MSEEQALQIVEYQSQRVLTTAQIARAYNATEQQIVYNFNHNKGKYQEGKHYICIGRGGSQGFQEADRDDI